MGTLADVEIALQTNLNSISGHPKIHFDNEQDYTRIQGTRYWRPTNFPVRSEMMDLEGLTKIQGIYQVDVFVEPKKGLITLMSDLDAIYEAFNPNITLTANATKVYISERTRGRTQIEQSWLRGWIEINYYCYAY